MATNVFGSPVTDADVKQVYPNITNPTAKDRAQVALLYMDAENKATNVSKFVHNLKEAYGSGTSTLCMIYNATGGTLSFVRKHSWKDGSVWKSSYPEILQNGQWAGFLHVRDDIWDPSEEAVVYSGKNNDGDYREWMLSWHTTAYNYQNNAYCEVRNDFNSANWDSIQNSMNKQLNNHSTTTLGCYASASLGAGSSPEYQGIMSLEGLASDVRVFSQSLDSKYVDDYGSDGAPTTTTADAAATTTTAAE